MSCRPFLALSAALLAVLGAACSGGGGGSANPSGAADTSIEVVGFAGLEAALDARRGAGYLLNFWAIWCAPCVAELPELVEVARAHPGHLQTVSYDLMVAGADETTIEERVRAFLDQRALAMPVLIYDEVDFELIDARFELPGEIPVTLAIDASGSIVDRQDGKAGKARFEEMMAKALGE